MIALVQHDVVEVKAVHGHHNSRFTLGQQGFAKRIGKGCLAGAGWSRNTDNEALRRTCLFDQIISKVCRVHVSPPTPVAALWHQS